MQIALLLITLVLSVVLYRLLSSYRATYPFIRSTRLERTEDNSEYLTTEAEEGLITIDKHAVIVEGHEYSLKTRNGKEPEAFLTVADGKLISITIRLANGQKQYFIDPGHSLYTYPYTERMSNSQSRHIFSI